VRSCLKFLLPILAISVLVAACGSGSSSSSGAASSSGGSRPTATVKTASNSKVGATVLVDAAGMTLYRLSGEHSGKFICASATCTSNWHPLTLSAGATPSGISGLTTVKRPNGVEQVAYNGMPLYTFAGDHTPGQANGQGFKDVGTWNAVTTGASTAPVSSSSRSAGGYGGY
jgi:predicted lipoprotein with Yx(FWY)xxD motif